MPDDDGLASRLPEPADKQVQASDPGKVRPISNEENWIPATIIAWVVILAVAGISGCIALNALGATSPHLEVVTAAQPAAEAGWTLKGRVLYEGGPVDKAEVWAISVDEAGNRYAPPTSKTSADGAFSLGPIPASLSGDPRRGPQEVTVSSQAMLALNKEDKDLSPVKGQEKLPLGGEQQIRLVKLPLRAIVFIPMIFAASVFLALVFVEWRPLVRLTWYLTLSLTFVFTLTMLAYIALGLFYVHTTSSPSEVVSLGFSNFYYGSYVKDVPPEWLMSFTSPTPGQLAGASEGALAQGFGAPLWVVFLSVLGAGVFTIALLVTGIDNAITYSDMPKVRARLRELVEYQFFTLFAPLGAIFIYQLMVAAGAASQQISVALAALAAGAALNKILKMAWDGVQLALGPVPGGKAAEDAATPKPSI